MFTRDLPKQRRRLTALVDSLATPHGIDRYLELVRPTWSLRDVRATVTELRRTAADSLTLTLRPNRNWQGHAAGQHVQLGIEIDGVRHTRCYSPANSAHDGSTIELTIKRHPGGRVSPWLHEHAAAGLVVDVSPAQGVFTLAWPRPERTLLISGGSGITPVMSMLRTLCDEGHRKPVTFLHYSPTLDSMPYRDELDGIAAARTNVNLVRVFTDEPAAGDSSGLFGREHLLAAEPQYALAETYVCGPAPLMQAVHDHFAAEGLAAQVHSEAFTLPEYRIAELASVDGALNCSRSGIEIRNDGRTLLEQAESAGLKPASGCRMGICRTCTTRMTSGTLRNVVTGATSSGTDVEVQLCVNTPVGDVTIDL